MDNLWSETIKKISESAPIGDFVECGTCLGVSAAVLAKICKQTLHLFDSWEGVSELSEFDNDFYIENNWKCDFEETKQKLSQFKNIKYYKGWYPDRFNEFNGDIALLHIDASLYMPTKMSIEYFWPKVIQGGYLIVNFHNDVSTGAKKAVLEYFNQSQLTEYESGINVIIKP